jgi:hypothetical protein
VNTTTMRRTAVTTALAATAVASFGVSASSTFAAPAAGSGKADLASVRAATAKYHDVDRAVADGYVPVSGCEELPGVGAMGVHYLNPLLAMDAEILPTQPELLLYAPDGDGLRLVAVEYFVAAAAAPDGASVLGHPLEGPMPGHSDDMPEHYDLHVWLWKHNPAGMFASWNPALSCEGAQQ